jgi:hypothetical protein
MFYNPEQTAFFQRLLAKVVGQPLAAAQYQLENDPLQQQRGLVRYTKLTPTLGENVHCFIEWQLLAFAQSPLARFQINLLRNRGHDARAATTYPDRVERSLSWVMWHVYSVRLLPQDDSWWQFRDEQELGHALANAGKLLFAYGVPWLEQRETQLP